MKTLAFAASLLLLTAAALAQSVPNCGSASMTIASDTSSCNLTPPYEISQLASITSTWVYNDKCTNVSNGQTYYTHESAVTGNGQCGVWTISSSGVPTIIYCEPHNEATSSNSAYYPGNDSMTNTAYDYFYSGGVTNDVCIYSGVQRSDTKYCSATPCPARSTCCDTGNCADPAKACDTTTCVCTQTSPIIIDTTGHGYHLTSAEGGVMFDMFGDGAPMKMAWTAASSTDAFLALPIGGKVHNGRELFGNLTEQTCKGSDKNGYCALAEWDKPENGGNGDGIIDSKDAVFPRLRLWIDSNHDGISQPSELHSLPELGVFSISLHYRESRRTDEFGNTFRFTSRINVTDAEEDQSKDAPITYDVFLLSLPREGMGKASCESKRKQQALNELAF